MARADSAHFAKRRTRVEKCQVQVIGMIGVAPPADDATVHIIDGGLSADYLVEFSRAHDEAGFDLAARRLHLNLG